MWPTTSADRSHVRRTDDAWRGPRIFTQDGELEEPFRVIKLCLQHLQPITQRRPEIWNDLRLDERAL